MEKISELINSIVHAYELLFGVFYKFFQDNFGVYFSVKGWFDAGLKISLFFFVVWVFFPSAKVVLKKTPGLFENVANALADVLFKLVDSLKNVLIEKIPHVAVRLASPRFYGRVFLWCSATDSEALLAAGKNAQSLSLRTLLPYMMQTVIGFSVLALAIWSLCGFGFALIMSLSGEVDIEKANLTNFQLATVVFSSLFFGFFILLLDRSIVGSRLTLLGKWKILSWLARLFISLFLASWVSGAYVVMFNGVSIKKFIREDAKVKYAQTQGKLSKFEEELSKSIQGSRVVSIDCDGISKRIAEMPGRLKEEQTKGCPPGRDSGCISNNYRRIESEGRGLEGVFNEKCKARSQTSGEIEYRQRIMDDLNSLNEDIKSPRYDMFRGLDVLSEMGDLRRSAVQEKEAGLSLFGEMRVWLSYPPNMTYVIFVIIDLIPLMIKIFATSAYCDQLENIENTRSRARVSDREDNARRVVWNPFGGYDASFVENRWHI